MNTKRAPRSETDATITTDCLPTPEEQIQLELELLKRTAQFLRLDWDTQVGFHPSCPALL